MSELGSDLVEVDEALHRSLRLHALVYFVEGDEVTIGRRDTDSYGVFPADGAELVRRLEQGATPAEAATWYEREYGDPVDVLDIVEILEELDFVRPAAEVQDAAAEPPSPVRWQRLGAAMFSPVAWLVYAGLLTWTVVAIAREPDLMPHYSNVFFTEYYTVIEILLLAGAIPLLFLHEAFHALAGRRLGLRSSLRVGRRLYFVVLETSLDGLVTVPRRRRYLPILAGVLADLLAIAALTITADLTRNADHSLSFLGRFCLAVAFATLLRIAWQGFFYLRTDLYVLIQTVLRCIDLHTVAIRMLRNRVNTLLGRTRRVVDESDWHPVDVRWARYYLWLIVVGYGVNLATFVLAGAPVAIQFVTGVWERLFGAGTSTALLLDSAVFVAINTVQLGIVAGLAIRDRVRARRARRPSRLLT